MFILMQTRRERTQKKFPLMMATCYPDTLSAMLALSNKIARAEEDGWKITSKQSDDHTYTLRRKTILGTEVEYIKLIKQNENS